jgi:hypothetical protein
LLFGFQGALLRKASERTVEGLWSKIGTVIPAFKPNECANFFAAAGYDAAGSESSLTLEDTVRRLLAPASY